jgi:hypothetical protein
MVLVKSGKGITMRCEEVTRRVDRRVSYESGHNYYAGDWLMMDGGHCGIA